MLFVNLKYFELYVTKIRQQIEQFLKGLGDSKCFCSYWHRRTSRSNVCLHEYLVQPNARLGYNFVRTMKKCWLCPKKKNVDYALNMDYQPTIEGQRQFGWCGEWYLIFCVHLWTNLLLLEPLYLHPCCHHLPPRCDRDGLPWDVAVGYVQGIVTQLGGSVEKNTELAFYQLELFYMILKAGEALWVDHDINIVRIIHNPTRCLKC